jgi:hypothetical protein
METEMTAGMIILEELVHILFLKSRFLLQTSYSA